MISQYFTGVIMSNLAISLQYHANDSGQALTQSAMAEAGRLGGL
jgi:hypothetical protein